MLRLGFTALVYFLVPVIVLTGPFSAALAAVDAIDDRPGYRPDDGTDEGGLWMMVEDAEKATQRSPLLVKDEALNAYVRGLTCRLAGPHCKSIRVYILDIPHFNASMYPNGMMHVWSGLLVRSENEAQLAFVLGHEIGHFLERHSLERFRRAKNTSNFLAFFSLIAAGAGVGIAGDLATLIALGSLFSFSRDQEREADARGFDSLVEHKLDPRAGAIIWRNLMAEDEVAPKKRRSPFFSTHPSPKERFTTLTERADEVAAIAGPTILGVERHRDAIKSHRLDWLIGELKRAAYDEHLVLVERLLKVEPRSGELLFFKGEIYRKRNKEGDLELAQTIYELAVRQPDVPVEAYRSLGLTAMKLKKMPLARRSFETYLEKRPEADDRQMIEFYLQQM